MLNYLSIKIVKGKCFMHFSISIVTCIPVEIKIQYTLFRMLFQS